MLECFRVQPDKSRAFIKICKSYILHQVKQYENGDSLQIYFG